MSKDYAELEHVRVLATTQQAVLVEIDNDEERWIPISLIEDNGEDLTEGYCGSLWVEEWKLEELGYL